MKTWFGVVVCLASLAVAAAGSAQTIDLAAGGANPIWRGTQTGARAGAILDHGAISAGDSRRDLVIGVPGGPGIVGAVYVLFGGPTWSGDLSLSSANVFIRGSAAGDLFGSAVAMGNIFNTEGTIPRALAVGAPGASSNKGEVFVFAAGFVGGDSPTAGSARLRIVGRTGDRIGASLATADLNFDGYREIVIGAPGNGRIYVIAGGPTMSGTIDLSVTAAAITFTYPGLGVNVAAGDITGDGVYDLLVGHPMFNAVHVLKGRKGSMPPAAFDMTFGGVEEGDGVGASIRLADVDDDGRTDIIVGAPDADGPGNTRPAAGEVYLIWGGPTVAGRSLSLADVTFIGGRAGGRMGALLAGGDINRDTPNDLVLVSSSAQAGTGALDIYYGRDRNLIGVPRGDGARIVDFANEGPDRSILGDTGGGTITAAQVYEVTGEGARDVIVGMSGNAGGTGAVYFTVSPRLTLGTAAVSLSGFQGIVSSSPVPVSNISSIPITWTTSSDRPWLAATPSGSTSASAAGDFVITANGQGLTPGTHTGTITVTSTSPHLMMSQTIEVSFFARETQPSPATPPRAGLSGGASWMLFWRHATEQWLAVWHMNGLTLTSTASLSINQMTDTAWKIAGIGDLNGDGHRDVVWQHDDGWLAAWFLQGTRVTMSGYLSVNRMTDPTWRIRGVGDTNGDARADLLWQNTGDGRLGVWTMNGNRVVSTLSLSIPRMTSSTWQIRAVGDTGGDGKADILWHKSDTGDLAVWHLNGAVVTRTERLSIGAMTDAAWQIVGAEDVNGDRKADIVWQNVDGTVAVWYLNGRTVIGTVMANPSRATSTNWKVVGPR
jgi:hypothetical protein